MQRIMAQRSLMALVTAVMFAATPAMAVDIPGPSIQVGANVSSNLSFSVTLTEILSDGSIGPVVTTMNFGLLASNGTFDPDGPGPLPEQPRSLNSTQAYQAFFGINAQQRAFTIKQTVGPLQSGGNTIPDGAFIVTPLTGVGGNAGLPLPSGITVGTTQSAVGTDIVLFSSSGGPADTMAATYGITDDPSLGATESIPLDQPTGNYITTVIYTATIL